VVVKDWCKRTFKKITAELQVICILKTFQIWYSKGCYYFV
jgi:hypothetical protein